MLCRRRCHHLGKKQRLFLVGTFFICIGFFLYSNFGGQRSDSSKPSDDYRRETVYDDFAHYLEDDLQELDDNKHVLGINKGRPKQEESDNNDFQLKSVHLGHSLLSEKILKQIKAIVMKMSPQYANTIPDIEDFILDTAELLQDSQVRSNMTCRQVDSISTTDNLDIDSKKLIFRGVREDFDVAVKAPWRDLQEKVHCLQKGNGMERCTAAMNFQVLREILFHSILHHNAIIKMLGYCIRGDAINEVIRSNGVVFVTEIGIPCEPQSLTLRPWRIKAEMLRSLGELLKYLESSPLGSLRLNKLTDRDFVCVKEKLKFVDLDEIRIGEISCQTNKDCFYEGQDWGIKCTSGLCKGLNSKLNLKNVYDVYISALLGSPPKEIKSAISQLRKELSEGNLSLQKLLQEISKLEKVKVSDYEVIDEDSFETEIHHGHKEGDDFLEPSFTYRRVNVSNFPGMYDFNCEESTVLWGCAFEAHSIKEAETICNRFTECQAFVAFTNDPERTRLFIVVLKNAIDSHPEFQVGVTLFVKLSNSRNVKRNRGNIYQEDKKAAMKSKPTDRWERVRQCKNTALQKDKKLRRSAEKRLMTHLGLKGIEEENWVLDVKSSYIESFKPVRNSWGEIVLNFDTDTDDLVAEALMVLANGPEKSYLASLLTVYLDRLLGVYHIPPSVKVEMPLSTLKSAWEETWFQPYKKFLTKRSLTVVMTVPQPKILIKQEIMLPEQESYVDEVVSLSRKQRLQMEYLILMWLAQVPEPVKGHIGYKGHMILYETGRAFQARSQGWILKYFYNCQFPGSVKKVLDCYKCKPGSGRPDKVCVLGHEVTSAVLGKSDASSPVVVANKTVTELDTAINNSATKLLAIMDKCVQRFHEDEVFY